MDKKMPWLKTRLRELGKTPAGLARHLSVDAPRVYEMIAGRRGMQPTEIGPTAEFLEWPVDQLLQQLPPQARLMPTDDVARPSPRNTIPLIGTAADGFLAKVPECPDAVLTGETARWLGAWGLEGRKDLFCMLVRTDRMVPWRPRGGFVIYEKDGEPRENDYVVMYLQFKDQAPSVMVRQLLFAGAKALKVRQHNPDKTSNVARKNVTAMFRVINWADVLR